jgi:hypothetical protein
MRAKLAVCLVGLILIQCELVVGQGKLKGMGNAKSPIDRAESRPDLATKLTDVAQLKIASRKTNFHLGEMITLDVALLNTSRRPTFFRRLSELRIKALSHDGQALTVQEYGIADRALVPARFVRVLPGEISVHSFQLLVGCDKRAFAQFASTESDDLSIFQNGSFLNWGDACLATTQPQTFTVFVEVDNEFVLVQSQAGRGRTAVGKTRSNTLEMTISN